MADIRAFSAVRYATGIDLTQVTCPPYDVLSPAERQALQDRSPHAAARLILPVGDGDEKYTNAAASLSEWLGSGVLRHDDTPALYVTRIVFTEPGSTQRRQRLGLICLLRLHEYTDRVVLPHEKTLSKPKEDRLKLLRTTQANVESIMALADDDTGALYALLEQVVTGTPLSTFLGDDDQEHTLFRIDDGAVTEQVTALVAEANVYIADGHHRYETSVAYARETGTLGTDDPEAFLLTTLSSLADPGLSVLPTHRLIKHTRPDLLHTLFSQLESIFDVRETTAADLQSRLHLTVAHQPVFGLVLGSGQVYQLTLRDDVDVTALLPTTLHPSLQSLDVVLLQYLVLGPAFGLSAEEITTTDRLSYTRDFGEAIQRVHTGEFDAALLLGRPSVSGVRDVSLAGEVMPQKSTFFYPKLLSGLVMRTFQEKIP